MEFKVACTEDLLFQNMSYVTYNLCIQPKYTREQPYYQPKKEHQQTNKSIQI